MKDMFIYGLVDPLKNQLKYVGKSVNPNNRYRKHLQESSKKHTYKDKWINNLIENHLKPELLIIDIIDESNWVFWEQHYIGYFKYIGCLLTNLTNGGDNPPNHTGRKRTKDEIEKIRKSNVGKKRSEKTKKNISNAKKGKPIKHLNNGLKRLQSHNEKISLSNKGRKSPNKGKKYSKEYCEKLSMAHQHQKKEIIQMDLDNNVIKIWESISCAKKYYNNNHISECCLGKVKTAAGFKWKYKN